MTPFVTNESGLDFDARTVELDNDCRALRELWSAKFEIVPGRTRLLSFHDELFLVNSPKGILRVLDDSPVDVPKLDQSTVFGRPVLDGGALIVDEKGSFYRWDGNNSPNKVWHTESRLDRLDAIGIDEKRFLMYRLSSNSEADYVTELIDPQKGIVWQRPGRFRGALPFRQSVFLVSENREVVTAINSGDNDLVWNTQLDRKISRMIGVVNEFLWMTLEGGRLVGLQVDSGDMEADLEVPNFAVPDGVVDEDGDFHLCNGTTYTILDLEHRGDTLASLMLPRIEEGPSLMFGKAALPTRDGRLIFFDRYGRIFSASVEDGGSLKLIWRSQTALLECHAHDGKLVTLDRNGKLTALAP